MASTRSQTTPPKGRPTPSRNGGNNSKRINSVTLGWIGVGVAIVALLFGAFLIARNQDPTPLHLRQNGAPALEIPAA